MSTITNTEKRLITMPAVPGHKLVQLLPGRNPLDLDYWKIAKRHSMVKLWLREGWIKVNMTEDMPDPKEPPSEKELANFNKADLESALRDEGVPVQWHPVLEAELVKREADDMRKRLPDTPPEQKE